MSTTKGAQSIAEVSSLTVRYGAIRAVNDLSLAVPRGSVYALLGRNGAGKSTICRCLLGQLRPSSGETRLFGESSWKHRARLMRAVGVVPESLDLPPGVTARQLASLHRALYPSWNQQLFEDRLGRFGIPDNNPVERLSKGQGRHLCLALALAIEPELLLLDDPTLGLDVVARDTLYEEIIGELADRGTTILLTTHDLAGIEGIATHVAVVHRGRLVLAEELEALKDRFRRIDCSPIAERGGAVSTTGLREAGAINARAVGHGFEIVVPHGDTVTMSRFASAAGVEVAQSRSLSLEEIFIALCDEEG
jgi:ABC-2 type transport system ATP-binding protein